MSDSRTRVWLSIGGAFVTAAIVTAVAFNLTAADSHDTGHTALEEETATVNQPEHVDEPEPIAPVGPFDEAAYRETLEVRVACANGLDLSIGHLSLSGLGGHVHTKGDVCRLLLDGSDDTARVAVKSGF